MKLSLADIKETSVELISKLQSKNQSACSLLAKSPGEEGVTKMLFETSAHLQVLARVENALTHKGTDEEKMLIVRCIVVDQICDNSRESSAFGEAFSAERRFYAAKLLRSWFE